MGTILWIGYGTMGRAIAEGAVSAGALRAEDVLVQHADGSRRALVGPGGSDSSIRVIFLAVKPQSWPSVAHSLAAWRRDHAQPVLAVSIMAGVSAATIRSALGSTARVIRAMPNTPVQVRAGMTAIAPGAGATPEDVAWVRGLFTSVGATVDLPEDLLDAATAVCGSGPAYFFLLAEALREAAVNVGLPTHAATMMASHTMAGAGALLAARGESPEELRGAVTSKGGTTAAGIGTLEAGGFRELVARAVTAARDRGRELGGA